MGVWDQLKAFVRREAADAKQWLDQSVGAGNAALEKAERRVSDDPGERLRAAIDDAAAGDDAFEAVRAKAEGRAVQPAAAAELEGEEATFDPTAEPAAEAEDVVGDAPPTTGMAMARLWVRVESTDGDRHTLWIEEVVGPVVGDDWFAESFAAEVAAHPEVAEAEHEDREVLHVSGPGLSASRARAIVAEVLAPRIGEDWEERLG